MERHESIWGPEVDRILARESEYTQWVAEQDMADMADNYAAIMSSAYIRDYPNS